MKTQRKKARVLVSAFPVHALLACCTATQESVEADFAVHTFAVLGPPSASPFIYAAVRAAHDRCNLMERPPRRQKMNMRHHVARVARRGNAKSISTLSFRAINQRAAGTAPGLRKLLGVHARYSHKGGKGTLYHLYGTLNPRLNTRPCRRPVARCRSTNG